MKKTRLFIDYMFYSIFPLKGSTYAPLGESLSKGYNLWRVREAGEGNSKKSLGNIQPPERAGIRKYMQCTWRKS